MPYQKIEIPNLKLETHHAIIPSAALHQVFTSFMNADFDMAKSILAFIRTSCLIFLTVEKC